MAIHRPEWRLHDALHPERSTTAACTLDYTIAGQMRVPLPVAVQCIACSDPRDPPDEHEDQDQKPDGQYCHGATLTVRLK